MVQRPPAPRADVVIVGAGIAGLATAWQIAEVLGSTSTVVIDPRPPLSLTSNRREANYRTWWPNPSMVALARRSIELVEALQAQGEPVAMDRRGYLYVTADPATAAGFPARVATAPEGAGGVVLDAPELRARFPHLAPDLVAGILVETAGGIDTVGLGEAMRRRAERRGVRIIRAEATGLERSGSGSGGSAGGGSAGGGTGSAGGAAGGGTGSAGGAIRGVRWAGVEGVGRIATQRVVVAAGPFAAEVGRRFGVDLPIETVLRQKVILHDPEGVVPRDAPFTIGLDPIGDRQGGVHIKPDDTAGPDALKLGWAWDQEPSEPTDRPVLLPAFPAEVLTAAARIVPGLGGYAARAIDSAGHDGGFYARTPDGLPLIGPLDDSGLFAVAGLAGFGAMMAAAAGELAAAVVLSRPPATPDAEAGRAAFDARRFADAAYLEVIRSGRVPTGEL